jgi:Transmembrane domain of unknown function (DUF3566)
LVAVSPTNRAGGSIVPEVDSMTPSTDEVATGGPNGQSANGQSANGPSANGPSSNGNGAVRTVPRLSSPRPRRTTLNGTMPAPERGSASARGSSSSSISKPPPAPPVETSSSDGTAPPVVSNGSVSTTVETSSAAPGAAVVAAEATVAPAVTEPSPLPVIVPTAPAKRGSQVPDYPTATVLPPTLPVEPPPTSTSLTTHRVAPVPRLVGRRPRVRKVTRVVRHVDPWSVFKIAIIFNLVLYGVALTSGVLLWNVAYATGTIDNLERFFESFGWSEFEFNGGEIFHSAWVAGLFAVVGLTGAAVLGATLFNLITDLVGGVRMTVLEEEVVERTASPMRRFVVRRPSGDGGGNLDEPRPPSTKLPTRTAAFEDPFGDGGPG